MTLIERDEGTAARRRIPFRLFTSDGTSPDTGATSDAVIVAVNSSQTFSANSTARALESAQGMYWLELTASEVSVLGNHALYHTVGSFPQHVATFSVVNFNPYSTQSTCQLTAASSASNAGLSADSVWDELRTDHIAQTSFGGILQASTVSRLQIAGTTTEVRLGSGETTLDDFYNKRGIALQYTNGDWITNIISDYTGSNRSARLIFTLPRAPESSSTYILLPNFESLMTVAGVDSAVTIRDAEYSAVTVRIGLVNYSGATVGAGNIAPATYSGVTVGVNNIDSAAKSDYTLHQSTLSNVADAILSRSIAGSAQTDKRSVTNALRFLRNRVDARSSILTVFQEDDSTSAWTASVTTTTDPSNINHIDPASPGA